MTDTASSQDARKARAAAAAIERIDARLSPDTIIGVGTGTTAVHFIDQIAEHKHKFDGAVASSIDTAERLQAHGIPVYDLPQVGEVMCYIDGADEANEALQLIKGGGGALTREKIIAADTPWFICIVDDSKCVDVLGEYPLPVEVIPMARSLVARQLVALGGEPRLRADYQTDNGNLIIDVHGLSITDPRGLESAINDITGVVTVGLFAHRPADLLLVASDDEVLSFERES